MTDVFLGYADQLWRALTDTAAARFRAGGRIAVIVPQQYTLDTEYRLLRDLKLPGFFNIEVLSPKRLCSRVFALDGTSCRTRIDRCGRQLTLSRLLFQNRERLIYYAGAGLSRGFIEKIATQITQLKQAGVTPEMLEKTLPDMKEGAAKDKLTDIVLLYTAYEEALAGRFTDGEDETRDMLARLEESALLKDTAVFFWGFDRITEELGRVIRGADRSADSVKIYIECAPERDGERFSPVWDSILRAKRRAADEALTLNWHILPEAPENGDRVLARLRRELVKDRPQPCEYANNGAVACLSAPNTYTEMHLIAERMLELNKNGISFGDMALTLDSSPTTAAIAENVLRAYRIPAYIAVKQPADSHKAARFLLSTLRVLDGWRREDMLEMIKTGFSPLSREEGYLFENYITACNIRGTLFLSPFRRGEQTERDAAEALRVRLTEPLSRLAACFPPQDGMEGEYRLRDALKGIWEYLNEARMPEKLSALQDELAGAGFPERAVQTSQIWEILIQLLDQSDALLAGMVCTPGRLASWLEAGLKARGLASLPPSAGCVSCGALGTLPLSDKKAVFVSCLCETLLSPSRPVLLSDKEQETLEKRIAGQLSLSGREKDKMRWLDLWKAFSAPSQKLILSYPRSTEDGSPLQPLQLLSRVKSILPDLVEEGGISCTAGASLPRSPETALNTLPLLIEKGELEKNWQEAWNWLNDSPVYRDQARELVRARSRTENAALSPGAAQTLFGQRIFSVSRLETYSRCPFKHFVQYGLKPQPRKEWELQSSDAGDFYHDAMEHFTRSLPDIPGWPDIDKKTCDARMDAVIDPLMDELIRSGPMGDSARLKYAGIRYRKALKRAAWVFTAGAKNSAFRTAGQEISFGFDEEGSLPALPIRMPDGGTMYLRGRIDRIDRFAGDEGLYLRVIDYKSSAKKLLPAHIWWGAQLQLLLYLCAAAENDPDSALPAGAFYSPVTDPVIEAPNDPAQIEKKLADALRLNGVALKDVQVLRLMDSGEELRTLPDYIRTDGTFFENKQLATLEELRQLIEKTKRIAGILAKEMCSGRIDVSPLCDGAQDSPCTYCEYSAICRRDPGSPVREMGKLTFRELLDRALEGDTEAENTLP